MKYIIQVKADKQRSQSIDYSIPHYVVTHCHDLVNTMEKSEATIFNEEKKNHILKFWSSWYKLEAIQVQ